MAGFFDGVLGNQLLSSAALMNAKSIDPYMEQLYRQHVAAQMGQAQTCAAAVRPEPKPVPPPEPNKVLLLLGDD